MTVEVAGPFKIETKSLTIAAKSRPAKTTSPIVAAAKEPAKSSEYVGVIVILGIIIVATAGLAVYVRKAKA